MGKKINIKQEIREYVKAHNNIVTHQEVRDYILKEKKIKVSEVSIRIEVRKVLDEVGGILKPCGISEEIKDYVKAHNNTVSNQEVVNYILENKKIKVSEGHIKRVLREVLGEVGGILKRNLKRNTLKEYIKEYVKQHNNEVTNPEVIHYILEEKNIKTTEESIRITLKRVLDEVEGILKRYGMTEEIRDYVKTHNNLVTVEEVVNYIVEDKQIKTTRNAIYQILHRVLRETGGTLIHSSSNKNNCNEEYL